MTIEHDDEDNIDIYRGETIESKPLELDKELTNYSERLTTEGNTIKVKLDSDIIIQRISHDLYKNYESGVRELFQNEARACRIARSKYNAKPKIYVTLNPDTRSFRIKGIDSLGISEAVFDKVLTVLGKSGNLDGSEVGQFGMGFASYTTLSEVIIVNTWYREKLKSGQEQLYGFMGDRGVDFKILPKPDMETHGTEIIVTYKEICKPSQIVDTIVNCARFCGVPVTLDIQADINDGYGYGSDEESFRTAGVYEIETFKGSQGWLQYQAQQDITTREKRTRWYREVHIDHEDFTFDGCITITSEDNQNFTHVTTPENRYINLLAGVPIEMSFDLPDNLTRYVLNIKDERKYRPTADRDRITAEAEDSIQKLFDEEILKSHWLDDLVVHSITELRSSLDKPFFQHFNRFEDFINEDDRQVVHDTMAHLRESFPCDDDRHRNLEAMLSTNAKIFRLKSLRSELCKRIRKHFDGQQCYFFRFKKSGYYRTDERFDKMVAVFKEVGVIAGEEYVKEHKIRPIKKPKAEVVPIIDDEGNTILPMPVPEPEPEYVADKSVVLHHINRYEQEDTRWGSYAHGEYKHSSTLQNINEIAGDDEHDVSHMYVIEDDFQTYKDIMWSLRANVVLMKKHKGIATNITRIKDSNETYKEFEVMTNSGTKLLKDIEDETMTLVVHDNLNIADKFNEDNIEHYKTYCEALVLVALNEDEAFKIACSLSSMGKTVKIPNGYNLANMMGYRGIYSRNKDKVCMILLDMKGQLDDDLYTMFKETVRQNPNEAVEYKEMALAIQARLINELSE